MNKLHLPLLALTLTAVACGEPPPDATPSPTAAAGVTYYEDIAPLIGEYCLSCHQSGAIAPFALDDYDRAKQWGPALVQSVETREMPPFAAVNDGSCQEFEDSPWLTDAEIALFTQWEAGGFQAGDAANDPNIQPEIPTLEGQITVHQMTERYTPVISGNPGANKDDYRCFLFEPGIEKSAFVTGVDFQPGNATIVHHALVFTVDPNQVVGSDEGGGEITNAMQMQSLSETEPDRAGWPCYSLAGDGVEPNGLLSTWAPGQGALNLPKDTGVTIREGDQLIVQIHYNLDNGAGSDQSQLSLEINENVAEKAYVVLYDGLTQTLATEEPFIMEPGKSNIPFIWSGGLQPLADFLTEFDPVEFPIPPEQFRIHGIYPHAHNFATSMCIYLSTLESAPESSDTSTCMDLRQEDQCLIQVPQWDFNWQHFYAYSQPFEVNSSQYIHMKCNYNTQGAVQPIWPGESSTDEMCLMGLYFTIP